MKWVLIHPLHKEWIDWFMTLPLWIELNDIRVVHACWHDKSMNHLQKNLGQNNTLTEQMVYSSSIKGSDNYIAVENICKGLEIDLPNGLYFSDKQGIRRTKSRVKWWDKNATTYKKSALIGPLASSLPNIPLPKNAMTLYDNKKHVFFGHYWITGKPSILSNKICCVDYSAAFGDEPLVAYRFDGEDNLSNDKLIHVKSTIEPVVKTKKPKIFT